MSTSPNLRLPYLDANQNQKTVTHNAALRMLDALVNLRAASASLAAPPAGPNDGQCWIVASGGTGAWAGKDLNIAAWQDGAWSFYAPNPGAIAYVDTLGGALLWNGTAWVSLLGAITSLALNTLGIGTAADAANPLSAKLNAALLTALPTTASPAGTGDVRLKLSKQASGNTASFLFADAFASRAEIGLVGDDNFHLKVSPDGATFFDAMMVAAAGGAVSFLASPGAPTPSSGDNSTRLATTAYADRATAALVARSQVSDAAYTVLATDRTVAMVSLSAARILTLPAAAVYPPGATLTVVDESGACSAVRTVTLAVAGADTINGSASAVIAWPYGYLAVESNGFNKWTVIDQAIAPAALAIVAQGAAGSQTQFGVLEQLVTLAGVSTVSTIQIPNRAIVFAVSSRTVTAVTGAPSFGVGISGNATQFGGALGAAAGSTNSGVIGPTAFYSPTPVVITATSGSFTGGSVRVAIHYALFNVPTS